MLRLEALEVIQRFRKPGGDDFALFCNKILRASCWAGGVPLSDLWTTSRTDAKDKGVDTRVGCNFLRFHDQSHHIQMGRLGKDASDFPNFGGRQMGLIWEKATRHVRSLNIGGRLCPCPNPTWATMKTEIRLRAAKTIAKLA